MEGDTIRMASSHRGDVCRTEEICEGDSIPQALPIEGEVSAGQRGSEVFSFPLNTSRKVTYNGYYIKRTAEATYLVCVATPESDDEVYHLGSSDNTYIVDEERGVHYRARGSQPSGTWAQDFHVRGMKGQTIALTIVFPPIPGNVERVRIYGVGDWNLRGQEFRLKDIEENRELRIEN